MSDPIGDVEDGVALIALAALLTLIVFLGLEGAAAYHKIFVGKGTETQDNGSRNGLSAYSFFDGSGSFREVSGMGNLWRAFTGWLSGLFSTAPTPETNAQGAQEVGLAPGPNLDTPGAADANYFNKPMQG